MELKSHWDAFMDSLIVHQLASTDLSGSSEHSQWSDDALLHCGRDLVSAATGTADWPIVRRVVNVSLEVSKNVYIYGKSPPLKGCWTPRELEEWNVHLDEDVPKTDSLDDFATTLVGYDPLIYEAGRLPSEINSTDSTLGSRPSEALIPVAAPGASEDMPSNKPAWKDSDTELSETCQNYAFEIDTEPLSGIIPYPYRFSSDALSRPPPSKETLHSCGILSFTKRLPTLMSPPYDRDRVQKLLNAETIGRGFRCGWIIPLRGSLPWEACSKARIVRVLHSSDTNAGGNQTQLDVRLLRSVSVEDETTITWTRPVIQSFWTFLLALRSQGNLGSLALSFHIPIPDPLYSLPGDLLSTEFIKIYCDIELAMYVRNVLDAWGYKTEIRSERREKVRVLRERRLVLVDGCNRGVLVV